MIDRIHRRHGAVALALGIALAALTAPVHATDVMLSADQQWRSFSVDDLLSQSFDTKWIDDTDGSPLNFVFSVASGSVGRFTVVDGAFAGDTFAVSNFGSALGSTSAVPMTTYETATNAGLDFDAALADPAFSRAVFTLPTGDYRIGGALLQSVSFNGAPLNATVGAVRLSVSVVPEPSTAALLLVGLLMFVSLSKRLRA